MAHAQSERSEVTFSGGTAIQFNVPLSETATPVSLGGAYSYRPFRHLALEAGVLTAIHPAGVIRQDAYAFYPKDLFTWVQFGPRVILPVWEGRLELSAGAGGAYENYSASKDAFGYLFPRSGWGGNFSAGAAVALDHGRHFWLGTTPRWMLVNAGAMHDRWFIAGGEFSFRF